MNIFLERYKELLGDDFKGLQAAKDFHSLRINTLKISEKELIERLENEKVKLEKVEFLDYGYSYQSSFSLGATPEYLMGYYYLQEAASQIPVQILGPKENEIVLDMAAAPGSKTTQIAQYMKNKGKLIAVDSNISRIIALRNNIERCGVTNTIIYQKDARFIKDFGIQFDKVLLDAPCSGNFITDAEWFGKRTVESINERAELQKELLKAAISVTKKNGLIFYSTCSLEPEENEFIVDWALSKGVEIFETDLKIGSPGLTEALGKKLNKDVAKTRRFWPHKTNTQGFFVALLRKK